METTLALNPKQILTNMYRYPKHQRNKTKKLKNKKGQKVTILKKINNKATIRESTFYRHWGPSCYNFAKVSQGDQ